MTGILVVLGVVILGAASTLAIVALRPAADPYVPEAADAPDSVDEHFKSSPRVVAGSDIDRLLAIRQAETDAAFDALVATQLADLDAHLSDFYVLPEANS